VKGAGGGGNVRPLSSTSCAPLSKEETLRIAFVVFCTYYCLLASLETSVLEPGEGILGDAPDVVGRIGSIPA
jgi:hypothetical protein